MSKEIKIGIFGLSRGFHYASLMASEDAIEIVALCDYRPERLKEAQDAIPNAKGFSHFDDFLAWGKENGMNAVFLANYFHEHTPFAIKIMEAGMAAISECLPATTMKECVELVRAYERTGAKYMFAENYPYMVGNQELARLCKDGTLGTIMYLEGEYNHLDPAEDLLARSPGKYHWRNWEPRAYYLTHSLCPLMYMIDSEPRYISAQTSVSELQKKEYSFRAISDGLAMMLCKFENGAVGRFSGCNGVTTESCYRVFGDLGAAEWGGAVEEGKVRLTYKYFTNPKNVSENSVYKPVLSKLDPRIEKGYYSGHGGSDYLVVQNMISYLRDDVKPYFDIYKAVAASACAPLALRSALNNGEMFKIPDFRNEDDRKLWENDDLTPFPDENGNGVTIRPSYEYDPSFLEKLKSNPDIE